MGPIGRMGPMGLIRAWDDDAARGVNGAGFCVVLIRPHVRVLRARFGAGFRRGFGWGFGRGFGLRR